MSKPNFLLIGAQKSATTSISVMLSHHPNVFVVRGKEPHFFSENRQYARGWDWYMSLFSGYNGEEAIIDASTSYSRTSAFPNTISRIIKHVPEAKILYSVRHPLDRMESAYVEWMSTPSFLFTNTSINDMVRRIRNNSIANPSSFEKKALQITGTAFHIFGVGLFVTVVINIYQGHRPESTFWGIVIAVISIFTLLALIHFKVSVVEIFINSNS
jgi:hypothetical protein